MPQEGATVWGAGESEARPCAAHRRQDATGLRAVRLPCPGHPLPGLPHSPPPRCLLQTPFTLPSLVCLNNPHLIIFGIIHLTDLLIPFLYSFGFCIHPPVTTPPFIHLKCPGESSSISSLSFPPLQTMITVRESLPSRCS